MSQNKINKPKKEKKTWEEKTRRLPLLRKLGHNTSLKILSLVFAIIIWSVILSQKNPPRKKIVYDVPVEITGMSYLTNRNLALKQMPTDEIGTVDVVLEVPMDDLSKANQDNVSATLDLSRITGTGEHTVTLNLGSRYGSAVSASQERFKVEVEALESSRIPIRIAYSGTLDENLHRGTPTISPVEFLISGPETEVNRVSYAQVNVDLSKIKETFTQSLQYTLYDADGQKIAFDDFDISIGNSVYVSLPVYPTKEVAVVCDEAFTGSVKDGYALTGIEIYPKTVRVAAEQSILDSLNFISTSAFSVEGLDKDTIQTVDLRQLRDIAWMEFNQVDLNISVEELSGTRSFRYVPVQVENLAPGFKADTFDAMVDITITAPISQLEGLTREDIIAYLDLSAYGEGQSVDNVQLRIDKLSHYSASITPDRITFKIEAE